MVRRTLLAFILVLALPAAADASFPGRNGRLAATVQGCNGVEHIRAIRLGLPGFRDITPACEGVGLFRWRDTLAPEWFADGRRLIIVERNASETPVRSTLRIIDESGREVSPITDLLGGPQGAPTVSPDGARIAFAYRGQVHTVNVDGSGLRVLDQDRFCTEEGCVQYQDPRWSPDGRRLAVVRTHPRAGNGVWLMDPRHGRLVRRLSEGGFEPDWSPDSRRIVFRSRDNGAGGGGNLFVVRADGTGDPRRVVHRTGRVEVEPVWSPDGRWIAWVSLRYNRGRARPKVVSTLWRMRMDRGRPERLATLPPPLWESELFAEPDVAWQPLR